MLKSRQVLELSEANRHAGLHRSKPRLSSTATVVWFTDRKILALATPKAHRMIECMDLEHSIKTLLYTNSI